jgi:hypothetical protein
MTSFINGDALDFTVELPKLIETLTHASNNDSIPQTNRLSKNTKLVSYLKCQFSGGREDKTEYPVWVF